MKLGDISKTIVNGAGTMGYGIAINFALGGYPVTICDVSDSILDKSAIIQTFNPCRNHIIIVTFQ